MRLLRYQPINKYTLINLKLQTNWAADPRTFNDPFEFCLRGEWFWDEKAKKMKLLTEAQNEIRKDVMERIKSFGVVSYTSGLDNKIMKHRDRKKLFWSHYADSHKGMCLMFEAVESPQRLFPVKYAIGLPELSFDIKPTGEDLGIYNVVITKSIEWEYESEYRELFPYKNTHVDYPGELIGIQFGCRTPVQDIEMIWRMLLPKYGNNIQFSRMAMQEDTFNLGEELPNKDLNTNEENIRRTLKGWAKYQDK